MCARALTLWCAVVALATAAAYTVDCNHEYTDCDSELSKLAAEDEESLSATTIAEVTSSPETAPPSTTTTTTTASTTIPTRTTPGIKVVENRTEVEQTTLPTDVTDQVKPKPRLLNLNVDDLQNFANALHNQTGQKDGRKKLPDLSDVNLDGDEEDDATRLEEENESKHKNQPDKFFSNLQAPFHPLLSEVRGSEEMDTCKQNEVTYKVGERIDRGCEETCECSAGGMFECFPRCKHPYIRRGRRLNDPLCFESPVDECCSIIACATGNESKPTKIEICRYGNDTYPVGAKWNLGCQQSCTCERNSVVTCKPRCNVLPPSDSCINVQDPSDACCEVQICDVSSQDAHEETENVTSSTTTTSSTTEAIKGFGDMVHHLMNPSRPLVLAEPIGSVKVLQNNTVQVNLIHANNTEDPIHLLLSNDGGKTFRDVELKYSNLILNLEGGKDYILKTKETGTKFNFTMTMTDNANEVITEEFQNITKVGCYQDGQFYAVGEEFHIGCTELCECMGPDSRECAALVCPSHVGLEIMSKGCVKWAPSPAPVPPNCCPRAAKCLSDGTCLYNGIAVPNWTEVPVSVTGCEQRCFCENGELDCQEACTPLPPLPPQTLRCPPMHRPAPVNISDEDCCKQWGCVPNAGITNETTYHSMMTVGDSPLNYVTPVVPILPTLTTSVLATPQDPTDPTDFFKHLSPVKTLPKLMINSVSTLNDITKYSIESHKSHTPNENITVFTLDDFSSPFKIIQPDPSLTSSNVRWEFPAKTIKPLLESFNVPATHEQGEPDHMQRPNFILSDAKMHELIEQTRLKEKSTPHGYFVPDKIENKSTKIPISTKTYFEPTVQTLPTNSYILTRDFSKEVPQTKYKVHPAYDNRRKHVTILRNKDLQAKPTNSVTNEVLWKQDFKTHLLTKVPNPYETVLSRVPTAKVNAKATSGHNTVAANLGSKILSPLDLEHLLSQMEVESEVNRNLGRSADKNNNANMAGPTTDNFPAHPPHPSFLPTIPPQIHFPQEEIPDYDQNNIHHPTLEGLPGIPPGLPIPTHYGDDNKKLTVLSLQSDSPTSVKMLFGLPPVLVGLRGSVDLRYTDQADDDISHWYSQVFAPTDEVLTTPRLEFTLSGLKPSTTYKIRGKLFLHNLPVEPESDIRVVRTLDMPSVIASSVPVEEKRREVDSRLTVMDVNDTVAHVSWRHFSEDELQLIDGIQIRYRPIGTPIYSMTELLHHSRSAAELHDLRPGTRYEASMVLVPPPRAVTELHDPGRVEFTTSPYVDPYNWTVTIEARAVGSEAAELTWRGVPSPAERWVRVYRAAHACGSTSSSRREHDAFRLAARDLPPAVTLTGLEPNTRCRVWLELFLTNGKVKTSNVLEINTKSLDTPEPIDNEIESASVAGSRTSPRGDYYGALVVVGVVAALGALTSLLLLLVVVRRHRPRSVPITPVPSAPRDSSLPPYDNPAYKLELQQETMDL